MLVRPSLLSLALLSCAFTPGCGDDDDDAADAGADADADSDGDADSDADADGDAGAGEDAGPPPEPYMPPIGELDPDWWSELRPAGETICSRGSEFAFFVHPGTVNRVILDFIGGGACWNAVTCGLADAIFNPDVENVRQAVATGNPHGIYDRDDERNPVRDWTHIVIPYCTGDVHWGDAVVTYGEGADEVTINHKGAVNVRAVLGWVYDNIPAPEHVFVTGCSAGSYGSILWSAHVMERYPDALVTQFGDSGAGIITETFFEESFPAWNAGQAFPAFIPELDPALVDLTGKTLADMYSGIGNYFADQRISQYNTAFDENQVFYFQTMGGGDAAAWSERMFASIAQIHETTPSFASFIPSGEQHCILLFDNFYEVHAGGRLLTDFLAAMIARESPERLACTECSEPTPGAE